MALALGCAQDLPPGVGGQAIDDIPPLPDPFADATAIDVEPSARRAVGYPRFDLSYELPYNGPEQRFTMEVEPRAGRLDVHLSVDTTGSFGGEIQQLRASLQEVLIPRLRERVSNLAMGVSRFGDFPVRPFGLQNDQPYNLLTPITTDFDRVARAVHTLDRPLQNGGDPPESWIEALYQIATGEGLATGGATIERFTPSADTVGGGTAGGVGFREGAARVVINITDAPSHDPYAYGAAAPGTHTLEQAATALRRVNARMIGIASGDPARAQLQQLALLTEAVVPPTSGVCFTGLRGAPRPPVSGQCPLVFDIAPDGTGLADTTLDAITRFLDTLAFGTVTGTTENDPRGFVQRLEAVSAMAPAGAPAPRREDRLPAAMPDGVLETFAQVATRTRLGFEVRLRNTRVREEEFPQVFFVRVVLLGDGLVVGERVVRVIVPEGPKPDSAVDVTRDRAPDLATDLATDLPAEASRDAGDAGDGAFDAAPDAADDDASIDAPQG